MARKKVKHLKKPYVVYLDDRTKDLIEKACHYHGLNSGLFLGFSQYMRQCALLKANAIFKTRNRHRKKDEAIICDSASMEAPD